MSTDDVVPVCECPWGNWDVIKGTEGGSCFVCGTHTVYVEVNFDAPICSEECENAAWEAYFAALRNSSLGDAPRPRTFQFKEPA